MRRNPDFRGQESRLEFAAQRAALAIKNAVVVPVMGYEGLRRLQVPRAVALPAALLLGPFAGIRFGLRGERY